MNVKCKFLFILVTERCMVYLIWTHSGHQSLEPKNGVVSSINRYFLKPKILLGMLP